MNSMIVAEPADRHSQALAAQTRPLDWNNPAPARRYNLVVLGGGPAGLVAAAGAAGLGAKVALVEKHRLGGDCLHFGCVPSKALLRCARAAAASRLAPQFGVHASTADVDFGAVMERMRALRADIAHSDAARRFAQMGIDIFFGPGRFVGPETLEVGSTRLPFARAVIATGSTATDPGIPGLRPDMYLTNESIFHLTQRPQRLLVIGAGPIGCELAQAFANLGSEVHLLNRSPGVLSREEPEAGAMVAEQLRRDGVRLHLGVTVRDAFATGLRFEKNGSCTTLEGDAILAATGRRPNLADLALPSAGVEFTDQGVTVDDQLRTSNRRIFAAGDVCSDQPFTHTADAMARLVIRNALFFGRARWSRVVVPHCTYTTPEVASVGLTAKLAAAKGLAIETFRVPFSEVDRAVLDGETDGFAIVHVRAGSDRIVGATVAGNHAGDLIQELVLAMSHKIGLGELASIVRSYPTRSRILSKLADAYQRTRLTPRRAAILAWLLRLRR